MRVLLKRLGDLAVSAWDECFDASMVRCANDALKKRLEQGGISYQSYAASYGLPLQHYVHEAALNLLLKLPGGDAPLSTHHHMLLSVLNEAIVYNASGFMHAADNCLQCATSLQDYIQASEQKDQTKIDNARKSAALQLAAKLKSADPNFAQKLFDLKSTTLSEPAKLIIAHARELSDKKQSKPDQVFIPWIAQPLNKFKLLACQAQKEGLDHQKNAYSRLLQDIIDEIKVDHLIFGIQESVIRKTGLRLVADNTFVSRAGLIYGPDPKFGNSLLHVAAHLKPSTNPKKSEHTIFLGDDLADVILLLDEAWSKRGEPLAKDKKVYLIDMGRIIGEKGERIIRLVVLRPQDLIMQTAYPWKTKEI